MKVTYEMHEDMPERLVVSEGFERDGYWRKTVGSVMTKLPLGRVSRLDDCVRYQYEKGGAKLKAHLTYDETVAFLNGDYPAVRDADVLVVTDMGECEEQPTQRTVTGEELAETARKVLEGGKKYDVGKPAARLIPIHTLPGLDAQVWEFCLAVYRQDIKRAMELFPDLFGESVAEAGQAALDYGLEKYGEEGSWADVPDAYRRYRDALSRHILALYYEKEDRDSESLLPHASHIAANLMFLRHFQMGGNIR